MFGPSSPLSSRRSRRISPVSARTAGSKDGAAGAGGTAGGATSPRLSPRHDKGPKGDRMDRAADKGPQMSPLSPSSSTDVSQNQSPRLSPRLSPSLSSSPVETPKMSTPTSRPEGGVFRSISAASTAHTLTGISESGLTIAHAAMEAMQEETAKAAAVRMQLEDQSRRLEAQLASANQMRGPLIQSHQQVQHLLQQMRPQARKQVFDGAVSPKVPLSPRQVSCGPVARRTIHVASTVRSPRMVAPPVVATVATVPPTVPGVATPIVRSVSIPGHVTPTPMAGYPTERWSSSVPNNVSQLASVASAVRASAEDGLESQSLKQLQSSNSIGIQTADGQEDEELLQKLMLVAEAASLITERSGMLEVKEARDRLQEVLAQGRARNLPKERLAPTERQRRRIHNLYQDLKGHLRIYCRVRPLNNKEKRNKDREALKVDGTKLQVPLTGDMFEFDGVFDMTSSQEDIFDASCDLAQSALDGRNVTVFCYGITGAGKTYTMYGAPGADGLTQRMIGEVFRKARLGGDNVTISGSMMELYNNYLVDLLRPIDWQGRQNPTLSLRLDKSGSVQVEGLAKEPAMDETELQAMFHRGLEQRAVAAHAMNAESSRSHVLFTVYVTREVEEGEGQVVSKLHFCDLGGCERLKKTEVEKEDRRLEAIEINKSLSALGDVIEAVAKKKKYVPYRNHKLTQLLQDAIGGGAKALMYVNCSPAHSTIRETANALKLANRAKSIVNLSADVKCPPSSPSSPGAAWTRRP